MYIHIMYNTLTFFCFFCILLQFTAPQCNGRGEVIVTSNTTNNETRCRCYDGYTGDTCLNCTKYCGEGGTCEVKENKNITTCNCKPGFTGDLCDTEESDVCLFHKCQNNSTCQPDSNKTIKYKCNCDKNANVFTGTFCNETKCSLDCTSNTVCALNSDGDEYCKCSMPGRTGQRCETDIDECEEINICNNGNCTNTNNSFNCTCEFGWSGERCTSGVKRCGDIAVCNNGTCIADNSIKDGFRCSCDKGFEGQFCDLLKCKNNPCLHGGKCRGDGTCSCLPGFTGDKCENNKDNCHGKNCNNGTCVERNNSYICNCSTGYTGSHCREKSDICSQPITFCVNGECSNNSTSPLGYTCVCDDGFTGENCSTEMTKCSSCVHGVCTNGVCVCDVGFTGTSCTEKECIYPNCTQSSGQCNPICNSPECGYSNFTCTLGINPYKDCPQCADLGSNGVCDQQCNNARCTFDGGECHQMKTCTYEDACRVLYNNSKCDELCNNAACGFDDMSCSTKEKKLVDGKLVMIVGGTLEEFGSKQSSFERQLSILLNSHVTVDKVEYSSSSGRSRRAVSGRRLQVKSSMDNRECSSGCFATAHEAANYIAVKKSKNQLNLPVAVYAVSSEPSQPEPPGPPIAPFWIALLVIAPLILVGMIYKGARVVTKLWKVENPHIDPGTRMGPVGREENEIRSLENDSPDIHENKRIKLDILGSSEFLSNRTMGRFHDSTVPFLANQNKYNNTLRENLLHAAIHMHDINRVRELLDTIDINIRDSLGRTALQLSLTTQQPHIFDLLIRNRALNPDLQDNKGGTCLMVAVEYNFNRQVEELISLGCKVTLSNREGKTALHMAAKLNNSKAADILIKHGAKVDAPDNQMRTPLYLAAKEQSYETAVVLVSNYANRSCSDIDDKTPLSVSRDMNDQRMIMLLSDIPNSPNSMVPSPTHYASSHGSISPQPVYHVIRPKLHPMNGNRVDHLVPAKPSRRKRKSTTKQDKKTAMSREQYCNPRNIMIASMPPMNNSQIDNRMDSKENYPLINNDMALHKFWEPEHCLKEMPASWDSHVPQSQQQPPPLQHHFTMPPTSIHTASHFDFITEPLYPSPFDTPQSVIESELSPENIPNIMELSPLTPPPSWTTSPESDYSDSINNC